MAASPAPLVEADQICQEIMDTTHLTETRNAAGLSHLHNEISDYPRVLPYQPARRGKYRSPTDLMGETIAEINPDKGAQDPDQGTWTLTFLTTAIVTVTVAVTAVSAATAATIARETLVSMARIQTPIGARQVDVITAGILHPEEGAAVPDSEMGVEARVMISSEFSLNVFY